MRTALTVGACLFLVACGSGDDSGAAGVTAPSEPGGGGQGDGSQEVASPSVSLRPANEVLGERAQQGTVGGDFVEVTDGEDQILHVRLSGFEQIEAGEVRDDGSYYDMRTILVDTRIENRTGVDSDGLQFGVECNEKEQPTVFGGTLDSVGEPVPAGAFVEGNMLLAYPDDCSSGRISATFGVTYTGDDLSRSTASWSLEE